MANYVDDLEDEDLLEADEIELINGEENADPVNAVENANTDEQAEAESGNDAQSTKKRISTKPRAPIPKLNADRLKGPRGLIILKEWFRDTEFRGKGHEKEDLDTVLCRLELWTHRLFPKFTFDDALNRIEKLGHKAQVANYVKRIRLDLEVEESATAAVTDENNELMDSEEKEEVVVASNTDSINTASVNESVESSKTCSTLSDEQRERMLRNRLLAEERRLAKAKARLANITDEKEGTPANDEIFATSSVLNQL